MAKANSSKKNEKILKSLREDPDKISKKKFYTTKKPVTSLKIIQAQLNELVAQRENEIKLIAELQSNNTPTASSELQTDNFAVKKDLKKLKNKLKENTIEFNKKIQTLSQEILIFKSLTHRIKSKIALLEQELAEKKGTGSAQNILLEKIHQFELQLNQFSAQNETSNQALFKKIIAQTDSSIKSSLAGQASKIQLDSDKKYEQINAHFKQHIEALLAEKISILEAKQQTILTPIIEQNSQYEVQKKRLAGIKSHQLDIKGRQANIEGRQNDLESYQHEMETYQHQLENHRNDVEILQASTLNQLKKQFTTRSQLFLVALLSICIVSVIIIVKSNSNYQLNQTSLAKQLKKELKTENASQIISLTRQNTQSIEQKLKQLNASIQQIKYETKRDILTMQSQQETLQKTVSELSKKFASLPDTTLAAENQPVSPQESAENKAEKADVKTLQNKPVEKKKVIKATKKIPPVEKVPTQKTIKHPFYGIQLLGARKQKTIEKFIKKHQLSGQVKIYQRELDGRPWFILIYGQYANSRKALRVIRQLSPELQADNPWVKKFP